MILAFFAACSVYAPLPAEYVCEETTYAYAARMRSCSDVEATVVENFEEARESHRCLVTGYGGEDFSEGTFFESELSLVLTLEGEDETTPALTVEDAWNCPRAVDALSCDAVLSIDPVSTWLQQADPTCARLFEPPDDAPVWEPPPEPTSTPTY